MKHRHTLLLMTVGITWQIAISRPADAAEICWNEGPAQFAEGISTCTNSVLDPIGENSYGPKGMADGNPNTAWCAPPPRPNEPIWIELRIDRGAEFRRLLFQNGYGKSAAVYRGNSRPKTIDISTDGRPAGRVVLPDSHDMSVVQLPSVGRYSVVHLEIVDVYPGERYSDICLDYIAPDFEYEEMLLQGAQTSGPSRSPPVSAEPFGDLGFPGGLNLDLKRN